jgi:hypothetical protein
MGAGVWAGIINASVIKLVDETVRISMAHEISWACSSLETFQRRQL